MQLLNIQSSPRGPRSASIAVADAFLQAYRRACPELTVDTLNVWEENLPDFDQEAIGAKYKGANKEPMDQAETAVWNKIRELAGRFQQADRIVLGVPMWNFAYPYKLKQLIDLACQRHMLFTYDGTEYGPLLKTPRAFGSRVAQTIDIDAKYCRAQQDPKAQPHAEWYQGGTKHNFSH